MAPQRIPLDERIAFLRERALFREFDDESLETLAGLLREQHVAQGKRVLAQGRPAYGLYLVYSGQLHVFHQTEEYEYTLAVATAGDVLGEEAALHNPSYMVTANALKPVVLLALPYDGMQWLLEAHPEVRGRLQRGVHSRKHQLSQQLEGLDGDEFIYMMTQRHAFDLFDNLWRPTGIMLLSLVLAFLGFSAPINWLTLLLYGLGAGALGGGFLWFLWGIFDWRDDYFVITNRRVIWLEELFLIRESRHETPLSSIQSMRVHTSYLGRLFDFGDVQVRTFTGTGSMTLTTLEDPHYFKHQIEELIMRGRTRDESEKLNHIRSRVRYSMGLEMKPENSTVTQPVAKSEVEARNLGPFTAREKQDGDVLVYHKHPWLLIKRIALPALLLLAATLAIPFLVLRDLSASEAVMPSANLAISGGGLVWLGLLFWAWYVYANWSNDLYQLSKDAIIDREKVPLSSESTRSAPLRNVLSVNYRRDGIINTILNMGDVNIVVADETLTFENVYNPAQIQRDILFRLQHLRHNEEEKRREEESETMLTWLRIYNEEHGGPNGGETSRRADRPNESQTSEW